MIFNSIEFAIFFPIVTILFFVIPHKVRWLLLLAASCYFYMYFKPEYILILFFTIIIDYYAGIFIENASKRNKKRILLFFSLAANVGILIIFKYYNFIAENINIVSDIFNSANRVPILTILLPIGLSFHTFQAMSYTIEVYRGNQKAEKHFGVYALYVMFYPQLVAGPIERPQNVIHQFHEVKKFEFENFRMGLLLMAWGFFKKCVIADRLSLFVDQVYGSPNDYYGISNVLAVCFFSFQIFCDFSGYSDIALGSARCMGFNLMKNFDRPYMATSVGEFWARWHISLSTWFKDYVYIPLGGNRSSPWHNRINVFIVFLLSGIWHGANWTYIVWGFLHGFFRVFEMFLISSKSAFYTLMPNWVKKILVFVLISLAWIFFRAESLSDALLIIRNISSNFYQQFMEIITNKHNARLHMLYLGQSFWQLFIAVLSVFVLVFIHHAQKKLSFEDWVLTLPRYKRWIMYYFLLFSFVTFGVFNRSEFIYFQF